MQIFGKHYKCMFIIVILNLSHIYCLFDPVSISVGLGALGTGTYFFDFLKDQTYCRQFECCNERSIPGDINKLEDALRTRLFGQHIVKDQLVPALRAHLRSDNKSRKPLVISFHGTPGTGKNYVADMIAESLYSEGVKSKFVHKYMGRTHFSREDKVEQYRNHIKEDVANGIQDCPRSLFIFDEVDKMPSGIFESLTSLVDFNSMSKDYDRTKAIFIFLSNTAGVQISDRLGELIKSGTLREETKLSHFEKALEKAAYNMDGGLKKTSLIEAHVIDHYIPFLPLEKRHVHKCIEEEFLFWGANPHKYTEAIDDILKEDITYDRNHGLFATSGCKTLHKKVAVQVHKRIADLSNY